MQSPTYIVFVDVINYLCMNPYVNIWLYPKSTIEAVLNHDIRFVPILPLSATSLVIAWSILSYDANPFMVLVFLLFMTVTAYAITAYLLPELVTKFGKVWNGMGSFTKMQHVFALAGIAIIPVLLLQIVTFLIPEIKNAIEVTLTIKLVATLFCLRNLIIGISIAQGFTYGKSLINLIVSLLPIFLARLVLMM